MTKVAAPHDVNAARSTNQGARRYELVAIAASAGGFTALGEILAALPPYFDVPVVVIQHRSAKSPGLFPIILSRMAPRLHIKQAEPGEHLADGIVYVAPPDFHLVLAPDRTLQFMDGRRIKFVRSSANPLFESAAQVLSGRVIAVVLTGGGSDATDGVQAVKSMGGVVIVQDPQQAQHPSMPLSAIQTGAVDYILPVRDIGPTLVRLATANHASPS
jgi:two-component system, chemotaxis family, protein-glutamate methylesterase/glutaminase